MNITVLGSGIIGVCTAYFLQKSGHQVTVIDRQQESGLETSFANGGQISVCYSEPWSNFDNIKNIIKWIGKSDSPILLHPKLELKQILWGLDFIKQSFPYNNHNNIKKMLELALFSRNTMHELRNELDLSYNQQLNGILTFYTSQEGFEHGKFAANFMTQFGCERVIKTKEETLEIVPTLKNCSLPIFGSDFSEFDESGDAFLFTKQMTEYCKKLGVRFIFNAHILDLYKFDTKITDVTYSVNNNKYLNSADAFVVCLGSYSYDLLKSVNISTNIYPAKGYSITIPILDNSLVNNISLTDLDYKIVLTRLGNKLRVAGTAEFNGYNLEINQDRVNALIERTKKIIPNGLDFNNVSAWTGLRPATPGNVPIIGKTKYSNLFINSGHGTLGWTMAAGSGKMLTKLINE